MSTIQQNTTNIHHSFRHFSKLVHLSATLHRSNISKSRGVRTEMLFEWLLTTIFNRYSIFRAEKSPAFSKRTVRNCLNNAHTNWQRLVQLIGVQLIEYVQHFTDDRRRQALIIDDSLFKREFSQKTELLARVFDHDNQRYFKGFRALTLGWSDRNTFLPLHFALMSSKNPQNQLGLFKTTDQRRSQAVRKMNDVALELVDDAIASGIKAKYVLFDSWFASPRMFAELVKRHRDGIGMLKKTKKVYFRYRGREMDVKSLYQLLLRSKWSTKSDYLYSSVVKFEVDGNVVPMKLVFVSKRGKTNQYLVLATTKLSLKPAEIIQMYGRRWQIECYFKVAKQYLQFDQTQIQSYDGLCGHLAMVMLSYDILALAQRKNVDNRTLGDLFYDYGRPLPDIKLAQALSWLLKMINGLGEKFTQINDILDSIFAEFKQALPSNLVRLLDNA
ncbi:transposase [Pediococcus argentinicus]|uniref:IS4 family transposase n=1 Tax=Pediococcus argentinicus TaxID=480391 RepID=UPI0033905936